MNQFTRLLPPELAPYAQDLEEFKLETGIRLSLPPLGTGGGGTVLKAQDQRGKPIAIKVIAAEDSASRNQALREASILKQAQHAKALGGGEGLLWQKHYSQVDLFILGMNFIPGQTLTELILAHGRLPEATAIELAIGIAQELDVLHTQQIVHRDIKPDNVMLLKLGQRCQPVVVDFGIAKIGNRTWRGARGLTDGYAPPEQYRGGTDRRADVYALGATLYEMVTGQTPPAATSRTPGDLLEPRHANPAISLELELVIQVAAAYAPQQRFASMRALCDALWLVQEGDRTTLWATLQAVGLLNTGAQGSVDADVTADGADAALAALPPLPPLPLKRPTPAAKGRAAAAPGSVICPCCRRRCQAGEVFCDECGAALDPTVEALPAPAPALAAAVIKGSPVLAGSAVSRTPAPQFMSLLFARRIILGGPALGAPGKSLLLLAYWLLLVSIALAGRSLSLALALAPAVPVACSVFLLLLCLPFTRILRRWDETVITRRGQVGRLRRSAALLLGLAGVIASCYWLAVEVAFWRVAWFATPPLISILIYGGLACCASILIEALLA